VPSTVFGKSAPSNRINVAMIGMERQAYYSNLPGFPNSDDTQVVAVCEVNEWHPDNAKKKVDEYYKNTDCKAYLDFREINYKNIFKYLYNMKYDGVLCCEHGTSQKDKEGEIAFINACRAADNF
jgi:hypothetical protein